MDLDLIKKEIDSRKQLKKQTVVNEGQDVPMARDEFLYGLEQSLKTGKPNAATAKLNIVKERADNMEVAGGQVINKNTKPVNQQVINELAQTQAPQQTQQYNYPPNPNINQNPNGVDPREEQFYKNLQETKQLLGGNNVGMADAMQMYMKNQPQQPQMITNANALNEAVRKEVLNFMGNIDLVKMVEDAVKGTMMEIYQKEKVETALNENKDLIKKMVVETILALKKRNQQQSTK
jgi:hypothetical protein